MLKKIVITSVFISAFSLSFNAIAMDHSNHHNHNMKVEKKDTNKKSSLKADLSPKMASYPKLQPVKFVLNLAEKNSPFTDAKITMDLTMTGMYMPKNAIAFKEVSKGQYEADAMFTMAGDWILKTTVVKDNRTEKLEFNIVVD